MVTTYLGTTYAFPQCNITGNPLAVISWKRESGSLSNFRTLVNKKRQLEILNVEAGDEGTYIIRAHNYLGKVSITRNNLLLVKKEFIYILFQIH